MSQWGNYLNTSSRSSSIIQAIPRVQPLVHQVDITPEAQEPVLLVDVGCGRGQALTQVRRMRPNIKGRMVAQDLPEVIAEREVDEGIENMAYDFLEPQPVQGVYFLPCEKLIGSTICICFFKPSCLQNACHMH